MSTCACGVELREFWIWRDESERPHASAFEPAIRSEAQFSGVNARDVLAAFESSRIPKHDVVRVGEAKVQEGKCREALEPASA